MSFSIQSVYNWYRNTLRNPKYRWWIVLATLAYLVLPFDISPDFIPFVGEIDDVLLVTLLVTEVSQIAIEQFKNRQGVKTEESGETVANAAGTGTIDVDATPLQ